jgi:Icc-related predicted phosphoesterase
MKIIVTGDVHGQWGRLNTFVNDHRPDVLICCGDFGYFPRWGPEHSLKNIKTHDTKIYWCPGNHEDWEHLEENYGRRGLEPVEIKKNIFYCPIGSRLEVEEKSILFAGGADSIDRAYRTMGHDWFPQELLNIDDIDFIINNSKRTDIVISHTCPSLFDMSKTGRYDKWNDPTRKALDIILEQLNPSLWFFGHWHFYLWGRFGRTYWTCLNECPYTMWWKEIKL